jgi:hypothetical protein
LPLFQFQAKLVPEYAVLGDIHQASTLFSHDAAGAQCSTISIMAAVASCLKPPDEWTCSDINVILQQGDFAHCSTLLQKDWPLQRVYPMLDLDEMPELLECCFGGVRVKANIGLDIPNGFFGYNLKTLLLQAINRKPDCNFIVRVGDKCTAMICYRGKVCHFDSHSCNGAGKLDPNGAACALFFANTKSAVDYIYDLNRDKDGQVDIVPVYTEILYDESKNNYILFEWYGCLIQFIA